MQPAPRQGIQRPRLQFQRWAPQFRTHQSAQSSFPRCQEQMTDGRSGLRYLSSVLRLVHILLRHLPGVTRHKRKAATPLLMQAFQATQLLCSRTRIYQSQSPMQTTELEG
jgi:hypothetical protein